MTNALLNFVGLQNQVQVEMSVELEQELSRLAAILVVELTQMSGLFSYASLHTGSGKWYNLVLINDDQVSSSLKQGVHHQYVAYQLAPQCYKWIRFHCGILLGSLCGNRFEVQRTRYYAPHNAQCNERTFCVRENTYARDVRSLVKYKL